MRAICDACGGAPARVFCAADEAALCPNCDEKVHGHNKLANRHVRLALTQASPIRRCDICENAPAFFFCVIDGTSLCLQCDMNVHISDKRNHERHLLMGQQVELPSTQGVGDLTKQPHMELKVSRGENKVPVQGDSKIPAMVIAIGNTSSQMFDLNCRPHKETSSSGKDIELATAEAEPLSREPDFNMETDNPLIL